MVESINKIVQRFYQTRLCRSVWRKAKIPIPAASYGVFRNFYHSPPGGCVPHFRFKKDLMLYLNSSRAASSGEFKFKSWGFSSFLR